VTYIFVILSLLVQEERSRMTKKFIKPLYDTTIKYLVKSTDTRYIIYRLIYLATGIDLSGYSLIDQELNTGNHIKDYYYLRKILPLLI